MTSPWRLAARQAIQKAIAATSPDDLPSLKEAIDAAYPFSSREYYPYKVWLSERKAYFQILGIPTRRPHPKKKRPGRGCDRTSPGQLKLF
ncbi:MULTISPECIES: hypothetical protein [unclassified Nodularia (in: cyanobacteria)]|uniref:hypothetical protein n=1 Tax=unclassified Nodularia (in: cyanobacteria) TaxID=2656917 RepID=UPI001882F400|nr:MULTISPECIES: hypothetical protein [unclassified Nodularia (in: cyanobacteria)]MBE9199081.1 hypothetical protein [Nodularia sp. LEGE 06071]MCC2695768.1 hypothetical protein [Nodularia sp. LEGE 04288]